MGIVEDFYAALEVTQEPLGPEFESILYGNLLELYVRDDDPIFYWGA